jgi:uncharacterized protein (TIGR03083 family)
MDLSKLGEHYLAAHARIDGLIRSLSAEELATPAAACPGWSVADVVGHLAGIVEDALAGRLSGPPDDEQTAVQVERARGRSIDDVLDTWAGGVEPFAEVVTAAGVTPAMIDILTHEHDIRTALGRPGHRDDPGVELAGRLVTAGLDLRPDVLEVEFPDGSTCRSVADPADPTNPGDPADTPRSTVTLRTTPFEMMRLRLGRRSPDEIRALDWSQDPTPFIDALYVFGSRQDSLGE